MLYSDKVMDHFNNPRNVGVIEDADGVGEVGNPVCGDMMKITIKVDDTDHIDDMKFQTLGCGAAIATSSIVTEMAKGMTLEEAAAISKQQVADELGGLPPAKMHCSVLATDGLKVAVDDYLKKHGREPIAGEIKSATRTSTRTPTRTRPRPRRGPPARHRRPGASAASAASALTGSQEGLAMARVFVAMSGGVDSSVAAALLLEQGHDVTGVTMQLWPSGDDEGGCCSVTAVRDARRVCDMLGIPHYTLNFREAFEREVVAPFADEYAAGRTPNPCIVCNDRVKFSDLLAKVRCRARTTWPPDTTRASSGRRGRAVARARARCRQGPELLPVPPDAGAARAHVCSRSASCTSPTFGDRRAARAARRREAGEPGDLLRAEGDYGPSVEPRAPEALLPGEIVDPTATFSGTTTGSPATRSVSARARHRRAGGAALRRRASTRAHRRRGPACALAVVRVAAGDVLWHGATRRVTAAVRYRMLPSRSRRSPMTDLVVASSQPLFGVAPGQCVVCYDGDRSRRRGHRVRELIDCHVHTQLAVTRAAPSPGRARRGAQGPLGIVVTEHLPLPTSSTRQPLSMPHGRIGRYLDEVASGASVPRLEIITGIEADCLPGREDETRLRIRVGARRTRRFRRSRQRALPRRLGV